MDEGASVYLVEKLVAGKDMKRHVGLARRKNGDEQVSDVDAALVARAR